jgi:hypothetical protein
MRYLAYEVSRLRLAGKSSHCHIDDDVLLIVVLTWTKFLFCLVYGIWAVVVIGQKGTTAGIFVYNAVPWDHFTIRNKLAIKQYGKTRSPRSRIISSIGWDGKRWYILRKNLCGWVGTIGTQSLGNFSFHQEWMNLHLLTVSDPYLPQGFVEKSLWPHFRTACLTLHDLVLGFPHPMHGPLSAPYLPCPSPHAYKSILNSPTPMEGHSCRSPPKSFVPIGIDLCSFVKLLGPDIVGFKTIRY